MAFFIATGIISNDVVRKETSNGVLAAFRLETGAPRGRKLWIDIECWGHLAGTIAHHATKGRSVNVSGRLTQKSWRQNSSGEARERFVVTANDVDLIGEARDETEFSLPNSVLLCGVIERLLPTRMLASGVIASMRIREGRAGSKSGRLSIQVDHWVTEGSLCEYEAGDWIAAAGGLMHQPRREEAPSHLTLSAQSVSPKTRPQLQSLSRP